ncbi:MAG: NUDIX hydrolase, partial [Pseudomonadales bacterium]
MKPKDAATLIIVRDNREVLLGVRSSRHVFMPHKYVFPGGRVDAGDARVASPVSLRQEVVSKLTANATPARAKALAMTAVRETFEETGLILGHSVPTPPVTRSRGWQPFFAHGYVPALDRLDYVARAITPPNRVRRFDARFFLVDAAHMSGRINGNGELEHLHWAPLKSATDLDLSPITELVLDLLKDSLAGNTTNPNESVPLYRELYGK